MADLGMDVAAFAYPADEQLHTDDFRPVRSDTDNEFLNVFERHIYRKDLDTGVLKPQFQLVRLISDAYNRIEYLHQMADNRNQIDDAFTDKAGDGLRTQEQLHTFWNIAFTMENLFERSQYLLRLPVNSMRSTNWWGYLDDHVIHLLRRNMTSVKWLESMQRRRLNTQAGALRDEFKWLPQFKYSIEDATYAMAKGWVLSQRRNQNSDPVLDQCWRDIPEMTRLIAILLEREKSFDSTLFREHIFGCLYDKRIQLISPEVLCFLREWTLTPGGDTDSRVEDYFDIYEHLRPLYRELADYQHRLKNLFYYRYLMDWNWNRLWDRLYVVINPNMGISDRTIRKFTNWSSTNGTIAENVFAVHPIRACELNDVSCAICLEDYTNHNHAIGTLVLKTKCGHYFHPRCLLASWDVPFFYQNRCPLCRESAGRLRDALNFDPAYTDHEHEDGATLQMDNLFYEEVADVIEDPNHDTRLWADEVVEAYWHRRLEEDVLGPLRQERSTDQPSWEEMLG